MSESPGSPQDSAQDSAVVQLIEAAVQFPGQASPTLQGINLEVKPNEILAIVGPSGCGKSTLLRVLANLLPLTSGKRMAPDEAKAVTCSQEELAMVFQDARLLPWRTVLGNMRVPFELTGKKVEQEWIIELLELTGLQKNDFHKYPRMLSGGMKMRVAIARSLALNPKLLLLDEPFAAVDDLLREQLNFDLLKLQKQFNFSAVLVTHHIGEAVFLSNRLMIMSAEPGQIIEEIPIPWKENRTANLRTSPEFAKLCGDVKQRLQESSLE